MSWECCSDLLVNAAVLDQLNGMDLGLVKEFVCVYFESNFSDMQKV